MEHLAPRILTAGYLCSLMLSMGLELGARPKEKGAAKRQQRRLLLRGLAINLILLPLVAYLLLRLFHAHGEVATALLILIVAPGGRFAPMLAKEADADLSLSVEITLFLAKLTAFTAPPTIHWMLHSQHFDLPELHLIGQLVLLQFLPYLAGKLICQHRPTWAARLGKPLHVLSLVFLALAVVLLISHHAMRSVLFIGVRGWLAVLTTAIVSLAIGWLFGGPTTATRRSMAIGVNARDVALALFIATLAFPHSPVQLAVVGEWFVFLAFNALFVALVSKRAHGSGIPHQAAHVT